MPSTMTSNSSYIRNFFAYANTASKYRLLLLNPHVFEYLGGQPSTLKIQDWVNLSKKRFCSIKSTFYRQKLG